MAFIEEYKIDINLGLTKPLTVFQISDVHAIFASNLDSETEKELIEKNEKAWQWVRVDFANHYKEPYDDSKSIPSKDCLISLIEYAKINKPDLLVLSGDIIDFCSKTNVNEYRNIIENYRNDYLISIGNHESNYKEYIDFDYSFVYKEFDEVIFVSIDNSTMNYSLSQVDKLKEIIKKGKKIIIVEHVPIVTSYNEEAMSRYKPYFVIKQSSNEINKTMIDLFINEPLITNIINGHVHGYGVSEFAKGKMQYCCSSGLIGAINILSIR